MNETTHLSDTDLVDLLEDRADPGRVAHAKGCRACGARFDALRQAWSLAAEDEAPEPSPLFWDHLSARVGQAVRTEAEVERRWPAWRVAFAAVPVLLVVVAVAAIWPLRPPAGGRPVTAVSTPDSGSPVAGGGVAADSESGAQGAPADAFAAIAGDDESWELVAMLTDSLGADVDEVEGLEPRIGAADRALVHLTAEEQEVLANLIADAMAGGPSQ